jgi:hypothetical protein
MPSDGWNEKQYVLHILSVFSGLRYTACIEHAPHCHLWPVRLCHIIPHFREESKGKAVPLQALSGPEGSRKLRFPDFVTTAQDGGKLSPLRTGRLYLLTYSMVQGPS